VVILGDVEIESLLFCSERALSNKSEHIQEKILGLRVPRNVATSDTFRPTFLLLFLRGLNLDSLCSDQRAFFPWLAGIQLRVELKFALGVVWEHTWGIPRRRWKSKAELGLLVGHRESTGHLVAEVSRVN
jgi:hypothetical protein